MKTIIRAIAAGALLLAAAGAAGAQEAPAIAAAEPMATPAGIPMESPWRRAVFAQAHEHFGHPSWGWRHSERDYLFGMAVAQAEGLTVDPDVMFAAAFLHDWGGIARLLAATGDRPDYDQALGRIERFAVDIPPRLKTAAARGMAEPRVARMTEFLAAVRGETPEGARP